MAKLTKEELIAKINERLADSEIAVELMEDITDSFGGETEVVDEYKVKYEELLQKYKDRFVKGEEPKADEISPDAETEEIKEEEVIDVKEI